MSQVGALSRQLRHRLWLGGGLILAVLALAAIAYVLATRQGSALLAVAVPPLIAGVAVIRSTRLARTLGVLVAGVYAAGAMVIATTSLRGLTPAPGQPRAELDPSMLGAAVLLVAAALLVLIGRSRSAA